MEKTECKFSVTGLELLTLVFITLKLTDTIDWSWWWVLAPMWVPLTFVLTIVIFCLIMAGLCGCWNSVNSDK